MIDCFRQNIILDVMPLVGGYLSLPTVRLSKYIPADAKVSGGSGGLGGARLEPFAAGQVYNMSRSFSFATLNLTIF